MGAPTEGPIHGVRVVPGEYLDANWSLDNVLMTTVGVDIGTSTSHLLFSQLHLRREVQRVSSRFTVVSREKLFQSPVLLTPYLGDGRIDSVRLASAFASWYAEAGIQRDEVDAGVVILTGEALRRSNSRAIAALFEQDGGRLVCAAAGHNLEARLAAHGSGAAELSRGHAGVVISIDIGGGTTKLSVLKGGAVLATSAFAVGGRLLIHADGKLKSVEPALRRLAGHHGVLLRVGDVVTEQTTASIAGWMAEIVIEALSGQPRSPAYGVVALTASAEFALGRGDLIVFSGGVAEYLAGKMPGDYSDLSAALAQAVSGRLSSLGPIEVKFAPEPIRATAIGLSQFSVQLSGSTVYVSSGAALPLRNIPVVRLAMDLDSESSTDIARGIRVAVASRDLDPDAPLALAIPWSWSPRYELLRRLGEGLLQAFAVTRLPAAPIVLALDRDVGRLLGRLLVNELGFERPVISIDDLDLTDFDYVDVGERLADAGAIPVVIKSLVFPTIHAAAAS